MQIKKLNEDLTRAINFLDTLQKCSIKEDTEHQEFVAPMFDGFYESIYVADTFEDYNIFEDPDKIPQPLKEWAVEHANYGKDYYNEVAKYYLNTLDEYLNNVLPWGKSTFVELDSPKYYNYTTDRIIGGITLTDALKKAIMEYLKDNEDNFRQWIKDNHSSYDGFVSFYSNDSQDWLDKLTWDENELGSILSFILYNENGNEIRETLNDITFQQIMEEGINIPEVDVTDIDKDFNFNVKPEDVDDLQHYTYNQEKDMYEWNAEAPGQLHLQLESKQNVINMFDYKFKEEDLMELFIEKFQKGNDYLTLYKVSRLFATMNKAYLEKNLDVTLTNEQYLNLKDDLKYLAKLGKDALKENKINEISDKTAFLANMERNQRWAKSGYDQEGIDKLRKSNDLMQKRLDRKGISVEQVIDSLVGIGFDKLSQYRAPIVNLVKQLMNRACELNLAEPFDFGRGKGKYKSLTDRETIIKTLIDDDQARKIAEKYISKKN